MKIIKNVYFRLRFGLVNTIDSYSRLKIRKCHTKSESDIFLYHVCLTQIFNTSV